jgi:DNA-binding transcriptional ArsR family regulator
MLSNLQGQALLDDPVRNKGTAFTVEERRKYGLEGLLPPSVENLDRQVERVMEQLDAKPSDLELTVSSSRSRSRARPRPQGHIAARGCDGSWPEIRADLDSLTETEIVHDGRRFLVRGAPRAAASLALHAVSVALPPTLPPSPSD